MKHRKSRSKLPLKSQYHELNLDFYCEYWADVKPQNRRKLLKQDLKNGKLWFEKD